LKLREWQEKAFPLWWAKKKELLRLSRVAGKHFLLSTV